jgi:glycosyltransferase involved in cell wall biosynthesis
LVESSLVGVGFASPGPGVAIVETRRPQRRPFDVVLAQNAWNVVRRDEFERLCAPYPPAMVRRMRLRRRVAAVNLRRARRVVCLTDAMADLVRRSVRREVEVAPVWLPSDFVQLTATGRTPYHDVALVPGTVTWFKNPAGALEAARALSMDSVVFAGRDDGSGCWPDVLERADSLGLTATRTTLSRQEIYDALACARAVVLPSRLESLGFSLGEALTLSSRVLASPIPSHREVASRIGRSPAWLTDRFASAVAGEAPSALDPDAVSASWSRVGEALGLDREPVDRVEEAPAAPGRAASSQREDADPRELSD